MSTSDRVIASSHPDITASTTEAEVLEMARQISLEVAQQDSLRRSRQRPWRTEETEQRSSDDNSAVASEHDVQSLEQWMTMDFSERMRAINETTRDLPEEVIPPDLSEEEQLEIVMQLSLKQHEAEENLRQAASQQMAQLASELTFEPPQPVTVPPRRGSKGRNSPRRQASPSPARVPGIAPRNISFGGGVAEPERIPGFGGEAAGASAPAPALNPAEPFPRLGPPGGQQAGDDLRRALMLSQNPSEQMSDEMQQLVRAIEESKKSQEAAAVKTREEQDLELAMNLSKIDFKESLASYASMNAHSAKSIEPVKGQLRPIVVDGNNVGFAHGNHQSFSARGLQICLEYFIERGHEVVIVATEKRMIAEDREICKRLSDFKCLVWAPKRATNGYSHYDDNFIINYAITKKAIVVSNDRFRDLRTPETEEQIRDRTLSFMFVNDTFLPATDPKGRGDPTTLDEFLRF